VSKVIQLFGDVEKVSDASEAYVSSIFRVLVCTVDAFLWKIQIYVSKRSCGRVEVGGPFLHIESHWPQTPIIPTNAFF
jgi:hypothetical protein